LLIVTSASPSDTPAERFNLRTERLNRGYTVADLSREADVSRMAIHRLERGGSCAPMTAKAIADVFGVKATDVLPPDIVEDVAA
jgi:DNA-binding XRE family transcriptional regulator